MTLQYQIIENKILLFGDTFSVKDNIKRIGGRWNSQEKHWWLSHSQENMTSLSTLGFIPSPETQQKQNIIPSTTQEKLFYTISEFLRVVHGVISANLSQLYYIYGEISSLKIANNHLFFDLIEKDNTLDSSFKATRAASLPCALWAGKRKVLEEKLNEIPFSDGTQIKIQVSIDFRKEGSRIMAIVEDIDIEHTKGNLLLQRQAIVQELKKRNLYHKNKSIKFPFFPTKIALITAENSRACADFLDELKLSNVAFQITLFDCNVQGEKTSENLSSAFQTIAEKGNAFDCVVITRGGGSKLDLRWFDDLEIAKQIAYCSLPVITAVGHFDDISIADEVSFRSEKTPTAAARFLSERNLESFTNLFARIDNLSRFLFRRFEKERQTLHSLEQRISHNVKRRLQWENNNLERLEQFLKIYASTIEKTMQRGFSLVYDDKNHLLTGNSFLSEDFPKQLKIQFSVEENGIKKIIDVYAQTTQVKTHEGNDDGNKI